MHRDIKPDNLLIAAPLEDPTQLTAEAIKVNDFGISVPFTPGQVRALDTHSCLHAGVVPLSLPCS
jgi:serine/threonine protein kinase